jgi:hypothetical protein
MGGGSEALSAEFAVCRTHSLLDADFVGLIRGRFAALDAIPALRYRCDAGRQSSSRAESSCTEGRSHQFARIIKMASNASFRPIEAGRIFGLNGTSSYLSGSAVNVIVFFSCVLVYYIVIARRYFGADVIGGDTQLVWSLHYFVIESLVEYLQYPLWDPTTLGGFPSHLIMVNGLYQNFHPFQLPFFLIAAVVGHLFHIDSNYLMAFHKTVYLFSLNLIAVMLITRELCTNRLARLLPPLIYTLSYFQFYAMRDSLLVEGLPPALFFVFGLLYHANRRSPYSLIVFLIFLALWIAGFSYPYLLSSAWWVGTLTVLVLLVSPRLLTDSRNCVRQLWAARMPRLHLLLVLALLVVTVGVVGFSVRSAVGEIIRAAGGSPVDYDVSAGGQFAPRSIYSLQVWTNFVVWAPFPDIHKYLLNFDPWDAGTYHRYVGMALLPLLVIAALFGHQRRYVWPLLLTAFVANAFIAYGPENPLYAFLLDNVPPIRNTRPMAYLLPREATLLVIFAAGIGLDILLRGDTGATNARLWVTARIVLIILLLIAGGLMVASAVPALASIRHSLAHMAVYLGLSCGIILVLTHGVGARHQPALVLALLAFTGMDLALSASAFAKIPHSWSPKAPPNAITVRPRQLGPMKAGDPPWPAFYRGEFHNLYGGPYVGTRTWLVLATHPSSRPILQNWDWVGRRMKAYPDFRFFTNGAYIDFDAIREIDKVKVPSYVAESPTLLGRIDGKEVIRFPDRVVAVEQGRAGTVEDAHPEAHNDVVFAGWAIDEKAKRPAEEILIFAGDRLWGSIMTGIERFDIAGQEGGYRLAGFNGNLVGPPAAERQNIRAFALLSDGTARELQYAQSYPFSRGHGPAPELLKVKPADGPPTIYLHDRNAVLPNVDGREEKLSWSVVDWTPNHYAVRVVAPSDGYLLNLDNYSRYWKARVDGNSQDILRANFTMQAIKLAKGEHVVEWRYDPLALKLGWLAFYALFAATLIGFAFSGLPCQSVASAQGR